MLTQKKTAVAAQSYTERTFAGVRTQVQELTTAEGKPLVLFLASHAAGDAESAQALVQAAPFFAALAEKATLAAPEPPKDWDAAVLTTYVHEARAHYKPSLVAVIGYGDGAAAAYALDSVAERVVCVAGTGSTPIAAKAGKGSKRAKAKAEAKDASRSIRTAYRVFAGWSDDKKRLSAQRAPVQALQKSGADVLYTEYADGAHDLCERAAAQPDFAAWICGESASGNARTDAASKTVDLFLFSGQSNMAGRGNAAEAIVCPAGAGYEFYAVSAPAVLACALEPFGKHENNDILHDNSSKGIDRRAGDMVGALMASYYEKTSVPIVGVQASRGGQPTDYFLRAEVQQEIAARFKAAERYLASTGYTVRHKAAVWCQGETDADRARDENAYKANTRAIFAQFKALGISDVFIVKTGHYNARHGLAANEEPSQDALARDARYAALNRWQQELADKDAHIHVVGDLYTDAFFAQMRDNYHYQQSVYNAVGNEAGAKIAAVYGK